MLVAQTAAAAGPNQHSAARNAFVFVLKTDNFWFIPRQYSSAAEHIHSMFAVCPHQQTSCSWLPRQAVPRNMFHSLYQPLGKSYLIMSDHFGQSRHAFVTHTHSIQGNKNLNIAMTYGVHPKGLDMLLLSLTKGRMALYLGYREMKHPYGSGGQP